MALPTIEPLIDGHPLRMLRAVNW